MRLSNQPGARLDPDYAATMFTSFGGRTTTRLTS
jgi:hypothetical protein